MSTSCGRVLSSPEGGGGGSVLEAVGPRWRHLGRRLRRGADVLGPVRVAAVLEPVPYLHKPRSGGGKKEKLKRVHPSIYLSIYLSIHTIYTIRETGGCHLLGLDGDPAGALGRGGELVGDGLQHGAVGDGVVELLQARLHLRHLRRQEPERRRPAARRPPHSCLFPFNPSLSCSSSWWPARSDGWIGSIDKSREGGGGVMSDCCDGCPPAVAKLALFLNLAARLGIDPPDVLRPACTAWWSPLRSFTTWTTFSVPNRPQSESPNDPQRAAAHGRQ